MTNKSGGKPSDHRTGKREDRNQRMGQRAPKPGYYLVMTDAEETEKNYFEGLHDSIPAEPKNRLIIKVEKAKTIELIKGVLELVGKESQYRIPWIVFGRDQMRGFGEIIWTAEKSRVHVGWSNPCFEIWVYACLGEMSVIRESYTYCNRFADKFERVIGQRYYRNDGDVYRKLIQYGNFEQAVVLAGRSLKKRVEDGKKLPSEMWPACMVQRLVAEILKKIS